MPHAALSFRIAFFSFVHTRKKISELRHALSEHEHADEEWNYTLNTCETKKRSPEGKKKQFTDM